MTTLNIFDLNPRVKRNFMSLVITSESNPDFSPLDGFVNNAT
jgi:hypothetical protein